MIKSNVVFFPRIKTIKRPGTYFLINLAIADLFKILVNIPMNMFSSFHGKWMFDQIGKPKIVVVVNVLN